MVRDILMIKSWRRLFFLHTLNTICFGGFFGKPVLHNRVKPKISDWLRTNLSVSKTDYIYSKLDKRTEMAYKMKTVAQLEEQLFWPVDISQC